MDTRLSERARSLAKPDDLGALDAGGRLDLVARDDRAGLGQHHPHLDTEILELFSIMRLVISSVSGATVSWRTCAPSSRSTCGSRLSGSSENRGFCRSLATRSLLRQVNQHRPSITMGATCAEPLSSRSSITTSSRSRAAC